jgi:hypothetical protein
VILGSSRRIHGEILPPASNSTSISSTSDERLTYVATLLDDKFSIPGTRIRFGLFIVFAAWQRGAAQITLVRMLLNLTLEATLGAIPITGDVAHVAWKAIGRTTTC